MTSRPDPAPLDRRRARSRAALLDAAEALFAARGVDGVTIDDIVLGADVAKGTFYNHFEDKDTLARAVWETVRGDIEARVDAFNAEISDPARRCARAVCVYARFAEASPVRARALTRMYYGPAELDASINQGLRRDLEAGLASGQFRAHDSAIAMVFVGGVVVSLISATLGGVPARGAACELVTHLLIGLGVRRSIAASLASAAAESVFASGASS